MMTCTNAFFIDKGRFNSSSTFEAGLVIVVKDSKLQDWYSSSMYQVNKILIYSNNKNYMMFD